MKKDIVFKTVTVCVLTLIALFCVLPLLLILMVSLTEESAILRNGYSFFPEVFSLDAYRTLFSGGSNKVLTSYGVTLLVTAIGTASAVLITGMASYGLTSPTVRYRNTLSLFFYLTMVFQAGLVPWYLMCRNLGLTDNLLALVVPKLLFNPFNLFLVRNYMRGIPVSLLESAKIDGANDWQIAFRIYFPLSKSALATVALFYGIGYWNDWFNAIMLVSKEELYPLQYLLYAMQSQVSMIQSMNPGAGASLPAESLKMATAVITIGPIILFYPFLQKYFVKGMVVGAVKD